MAKVSEKVQEAIFAQLLNTPANSECADCRTSSPTWVSLDFGVFLCMRCSGVHRQIGPHITRVRSVRLDGWTKDNIEIMATIGNKIANDYYEHTMSNYSRKPGTNSSPEECRRFVDDKYIHKKFAVEGYPEPVKDFVACRTKGTKPDFSYSTQAQTSQPQNQNQQQQHQNQQQQQLPQKQEAHPRNHSSEASHTNNLNSLRKKSLSLDKLPRDLANAHHEDLLSADHDLLGETTTSHPQNSFGDNKQAHGHSHAHAHAHSASPAKINFAKFKKGANSQPTQPQLQGNQPTGQWNADLTGDQTTSQGGNNSLINLQNAYAQSQGQQQKQPQPQIDLKQLYNQGGHQNHFMQGQSRQQQNWNFQGVNQQGFQGGFNGGYNAGGMGMPQSGGQFNQGYGMQPGYNQQQMPGYQQQANAGGNLAGLYQMGYNQGFPQNQNQYQNNGFVQVPNANKFF